MADYSVPLSKLVKELDLRPVYLPREPEKILLTLSLIHI